MPAGIVPTTNSQPRRASVSSGLISRSRSERPSPRAIRFQSSRKMKQQHGRGGDVGGDQEGEEVVVVLVDVPAEQAGKDDAVAEARDRKRLGDPLQRAEDRPLEVRDGVHVALTLAGGGRAEGPVWNQAKTKQPTPRMRARMPCLTWWWLDPASCPGKKDGSEPAGSAK